MGGINIARGSSRHNIEKKLKELEDEKNKGNITLDEYDTLRIRYERKLGNKETVSKLQESKGFKPSLIKEKKAKKEELYDEFVDKYSKSEGKDYGEIQRANMFSSTTKRALVILFLLLAFGIGIIAGITAINNSQENVTNVTISDTAFSVDSTSLNASNLTQNTSNVTYNRTTSNKKYSNKKYSSKSSSNSYSGSDSSSGSSRSSGSSSGSYSSSSSSGSGRSSYSSGGSYSSGSGSGGSSSYGSYN